MSQQTGHSKELPFEVTSEAKLTRSERWQVFLDRSLLTPLRVVWSDLRSRIAVLILLGYVFMGTAGVRLVEPTSLNDGPRTVVPFLSLEHPLGTTGLGEDLLALIVHSTPSMFKMIIGGAVFSVTMATIIGTFSGYVGGSRLDRVLMFITDVALTIPGLPLVIVIAAIFEPRDPFIVGVLLTVNAWAGLARALRSEVLSIRRSEYVEASKAMDISLPRLLMKDILPDVMPYILINFANSARAVIFASVALYFLGVLPITSLNWGVILNDAPTSALQEPGTVHWILVPLAAIMGLSIGLVLLAQGADRLFNPRVRARHAKTISGGADAEESETETTEVTTDTSL